MLIERRDSGLWPQRVDSLDSTTVPPTRLARDKIGFDYSLDSAVIDDTMIPEPEHPFLWTALGAALLLTTNHPSQAEETWTIGGDEGWAHHLHRIEGLAVEGEQVSPTSPEAFLQTQIRTTEAPRKAAALTVTQSALWLNWSPVEDLGPVNLSDAPVFLTLGPDNYWMFGRYRANRPRRNANSGASSSEVFEPKAATLEGFDVPLLTTPFPNQYDAPGGLQPKLGGYHAWQSRDMKNWVHHGPITEKFSAWMTTAEYADGKAYFYYDFPNDQDPHVYVDADLYDGLPGDNKGIAYEDPSHGSDCAIIRDLDGKFHLIVEDWSPINAQRRSWDSPLAAHAVSPDGIANFETLEPPVDHRTEPTGETGTYTHPHWVKEHPDRFKTNIAEYEIHEPEQNAYGDWAAIAIGGQYYLFCDYDPAGGGPMSVGWFTSSSINEPFTWCGNIGQGHPDPDITFAEGQFYLVTQQDSDFVSPGPWVETVEARVGVDVDGDGAIDQWTRWSEVKETYDYVKGFSKQISKTPAQLDLSPLPAGRGFQIEVRLTDATENQSKPIIETLALSFE